MKARAILWDLDGTLVDSEPVHAAAINAALAELGLTVPDTFHSALLGCSADKVAASIRETCGLNITAAEWRQRKWKHYRVHAVDIRRRDSVADLVADWARRGVPMAVVSNSTANEVALCLSVSGLADDIKVAISRTDVWHGKPHPAGYLLAAKRLGYVASSCLVVEDSLIGVTAGLASGATVLYHPQHLSNDRTTIPAGTHYIPPGHSIATFLTANLITRSDSVNS